MNWVQKGKDSGIQKIQAGVKLEYMWKEDQLMLIQKNEQRGIEWEEKDGHGTEMMV